MFMGVDFDSNMRYNIFQLKKETYKKVHIISNLGSCVN